MEKDNPVVSGGIGNRLLSCSNFGSSGLPVDTNQHKIRIGSCDRKESIKLTIQSATQCRTKNISLLTEA